jgi:hypothetical protein
VEITFWIGEERHLLSDGDARWLEERIRVGCVDRSHRPRDADALACLQLADTMADRERYRSFEPIELDRSHARGLTEHVLSPGTAQQYELQELYDALLGLREGDA